MHLILVSLIGPVVGGVIAATVGFSVAWWKRSRDGRDRFHAAIGEIEAAMEGRLSYLKDFHASTLAPIRSAVYAVQPFIRKTSFKRLIELWTDYQKMDKNQLDWGLSITREALHESMHPDSLNPHVRADALLKASLQKLRDEVG